MDFDWGSNEAQEFLGILMGIESNLQRISEALNRIEAALARQSS